MTWYKITARIERSDGYEQEIGTWHDPVLVKDEQAFMSAFYNNTKQLWKDLELPTQKEIELQEKLRKRERMLAVFTILSVLIGATSVATLLFWTLK